MIRPIPKVPLSWTDPGHQRIVSAAEHSDRLVRAQGNTVYAFDSDTAEGREAVREFAPHYNQDPEAPTIALDYTTWLPFAASTYKISPHIEDYALVVAPICPADLPNRNGIGFPLKELKKFRPPPHNRMVYKCWTGCPVHLEHDNRIHEKAYGVILDSSLHRISGYGNDALWKVMGLTAIDKNKYPEVAQQVIDKKIRTYSMGALADYFSCSYCGTPVEDHKRCHHLRGYGDDDLVFHQEQSIGVPGLVFKNAHELSPIEYSIVKSPAWPVAESDHFLST